MVYGRETKTNGCSMQFTLSSLSLSLSQVRAQDRLLSRVDRVYRRATDNQRSSLFIELHSTRGRYGLFVTDVNTLNFQRNRMP